jgi:hypothetical protein
MAGARLWSVIGPAAILATVMAPGTARAEVRVGLGLVWGMPVNLPVCRLQWTEGLSVYAWEVHFDLDSNTSTGDPEGYEYRLYIGHFNACAFYDNSSTASIASLQRNLFAYQGGGVWSVIEDSFPVGFSIASPTTLDLRLYDGGVLQGLTAASSIKATAYYVPFNQTQRRDDVVPRFLLSSAFRLAGNAWVQSDPGEDLAGCSGCTLNATFEDAIDLGAVVVLLDPIYRSGFD